MEVKGSCRWGVMGDHNTDAWASPPIASNGIPSTSISHASIVMGVPKFRSASTLTVWELRASTGGSTVVIPPMASGFFDFFELKCWYDSSKHKSLLRSLGLVIRSHQKRLEINLEIRTNGIDRGRGVEPLPSKVEEAGAGCHMTMAVIQSVDNEAIISVVPNLPVTRFIWRCVMIDDVHAGRRSLFWLGATHIVGCNIILILPILAVNCPRSRFTYKSDGSWDCRRWHGDVDLSIP